MLAFGIGIGNRQKGGGTILQRKFVTVGCEDKCAAARSIRSVSHGAWQRLLTGTYALRKSEKKKKETLSAT